MAKGKNAQRHHREYWSRRPFSGWGWGKVYKVLTHRKERRVESKQAVAEQLKDQTND